MNGDANERGGSASNRPERHGRLHPGSPGDYQTETLRPIVSLYFVIPFLLVYELGVIFLDNQAIRNGLDVWINALPTLLGFGELLLLPLLTTFCLLVMHHRRHDRWSVSWKVLAGMFIESTALAMIVLFAVKAQHFLIVDLSRGENPLAMQVAAPVSSPAPTGFLDQFVAFCGAGLYEELVFRLILLPVAIHWIGKTGLQPIPAVVVAMVLTSLLFALAHYNVVNPAGSDFELAGFMVRVVASLFFCAVFLLRGFGIAVGTHVAYDVLTTL